MGFGFKMCGKKSALELDIRTRGIK